MQCITLCFVIRTFVHKRLRRFFERGERQKDSMWIWRITTDAYQTPDQETADPSWRNSARGCAAGAEHHANRFREASWCLTLDRFRTAARKEGAFARHGPPALEASVHQPRELAEDAADAGYLGTGAAR